MKKFAPLKAGDIVDVVSPGFKSQKHEIEAAVKFLESWGLKARVAPEVFGDHFLHSNDDESRLKSLKRAIYAKDSKAVWFLRGGYGSIRLLPAMLKWRIPSQLKFVIGISDITSLHILMNKKWKWPTLHAPLLDRLGLDKVPQDNVHELKALLFGQLPILKYTDLKPLNSAAKKKKNLKGPIVGGNLTVIQSTLGTPVQIDLRNKFLFVEDLGERGYRVDRILEHLRQAGCFDKCLGLIVGEFLGGEEPGGLAPLWSQVFERFAAEVKFPVMGGFPAGHGVVQRPLPLNTMAHLHLSSNEIVLEIESGVKF